MDARAGMTIDGKNLWRGFPTINYLLTSVSYWDFVVRANLPICKSISYSHSDFYG